MAETHHRLRKRMRRRHMLALAGTVLIAGGVVVAIGPGAAWMVDHLADGQRVGRYGTLKIDGVTGGWLGDLQAESVTIADAEGVWAEAHGVSLDWRPASMLLGTLRLDAAEIDAITINRQPVLSEARPPRSSSIDYRIDALHVGLIDIAEPVFGEAAQFTADLALLLRDKRLRSADLNVRRTDSEADRAVGRYRDTTEFALALDVESAPGGIIARALGVGEQGFRLEADGDGGTRSGAGTFAGRAGESELLSGDFAWTPTAWTLNANADLDLLPATQVTAARIGNRVALTASGAPGGTFSARAETPFLTVDLDGALDEERKLDGPARIVASTERLSSIAREAPFELGAARFEGEVAQDDGDIALDGVLDARDLEMLGHTGRLGGPLQAELTQQRFTLDADLRAPADATSLFARARLETELSYDRGRRRFSLDRARFNGDAIDLSAQGWTNRGDGEFSGTWRARQLEALIPDLTGQGEGRWRAFAAPEDADGDRIWTTTFDGTARRIGGAPDILVQLLPGDTQIDGLIRYESGGLTVAHARLDGAKLRAGATGRIVRGIADLSLEASARGPLSIGDAVMSGAIDATGRLTGRIVRPTLSATATLERFTAAGVDVEQPMVEITIAPEGDIYRGMAEVDGRALGQPLSATSGIVIANGALETPGLIARLGALDARGDARFSAEGVEAQLALGGGIDGLAPGLTGRIAGAVTLTPQTLALNAEIADVRAGELFVRAATVSMSGPYDAIAARFDLRGRLRRAPLTFAGEALISADDGTTISITGEGALAGAAITTRTPMRATFGDGEMEAAIDVTLADGALTARWRERGQALSGAATVENAPLAPLAAIWGERATGRIGGAVQIANAGGGLSGDANITLVDARIAARQRGALTGTIVAHLEPGRLTTTIDATSTDGLVARFEADAPVTTSASPIRIAIAPERRGTATWTVSGPAASLWAAARLSDQALEGDLTGAGEISFGAGYLAGDGRIAIANGRFEDKISGVKLEALDVAISIGDGGVNIERFTATDGADGRLTATGGSANPREGRIALQVRNMRLVDRPDARADAGGDLTFQWEGLQSSLSGQLNITEAEMNIAQNAEAGIPTLEVIEINRPGYEDEPEEAEGPASSGMGATTLDVRIAAPARVFTRGRGLEAEWSLDLRLGGTSQAPRIFGEARAIRGTLSLSGQPFEIESGSIFFNGAPEDARIELAATRDSADLTARILLSGTAADPDISFTSNPALPEDEILPQILFGRSVADLSAFEAAQLAASLATLSGQASFDLVGAARAVAGLDRFNVREDETGGLMVAGGVYLTREVYVEVARTGLGQAATRVEWTIRPQLVLITSFLPNGDRRVSVRWRRETD